MNAPNIEALLKTPIASARSRTGNQLATTLLPPEKLPHSPVPSQKRKTQNCRIEVAIECSPFPNDHHNTAKVNPARTPARSINQPIGNAPVTSPARKTEPIAPKAVLLSRNSRVMSEPSTASACRSTKLSAVTPKSNARIHQRAWRYSGGNFV